MTLDAASPYADPPDSGRCALGAGRTEPTAQSVDRSARPLGRGFEQISHLFLPDSAAAPVRPPIRTGVPVLRRGAPLTKDQLTATFRECESAIEDHLRTMLRGLGHVHWIRHNLSNIQRMCPDAMIDVTRPRLCLVAPAFSRVLRSAVRQIAGPDVTCFRYHEVAVSGGTGVFVERYGADDE
jgi:hypothetical protein